MNRGSKIHLNSYHILMKASMRPRFMNRGSASDASLSTSGSIASMRPRFMNRGSKDAHDDYARAVFGFNEAPIHESGK